MSNLREVAEGVQYQGADEEIAYSIDTTNWGGTPSAPAVVAKDIDAGFTDVSGTVLTGSPSVSGDDVITPKVDSLTAGKTYRIEVKFTIGGNIFEAYFKIEAQL